MYAIECDNYLWVGDGFCDDATNNEQCNFDGGDCCGIDIDLEYCTLCKCFAGEFSNSRY